MKSCIDELSVLEKKYISFLDRIRSLAYSALKKMNIDPDEWEEGRVYIGTVCKDNGRCYGYIEFYMGWNRKKRGIGPIDGNVDVSTIVERLNKKYGVTEEELRALFYTKHYKRIINTLEKIKYHIERAREVANELDQLENANVLEIEMSYIRQTARAIVQ